MFNLLVIRFIWFSQSLRSFELLRSVSSSARNQGGILYTLHIIYIGKQFLARPLFHFQPCSVCLEIVSFIIYRQICPSVQPKPFNDNFAPIMTVSKKTFCQVKTKQYETKSKKHRLVAGIRLVQTFNSSFVNSSNLFSISSTNTLIPELKIVIYRYEKENFQLKLQEWNVCFVVTFTESLDTPKWHSTCWT